MIGWLVMLSMVGVLSRSRINEVIQPQLTLRYVTRLALSHYKVQAINRPAAEKVHLMS